MRKIFGLSVVCILLLSLTSVPGIGQDASGVLEKLIEANGGRKALENIKDTLIAGTFDLTQMGMSGTMTISHKEPNMFRQDIEVMGMVVTNAFDGEVGWMINPQTGASEELPEDLQGQAKRGALGYGSAILLHPEKYGITYKLKGEETVDDIKCTVLEQVYTDGHVALMYLDNSTHLLYKTRQPTLNQMGVEVETDAVFSDYKDVDGIPSPHLVTIYQDGEEFAVMTVSEIKYNNGFEASLFKME